ncbi:MAG TPA: amino acid adenylation domain-containing protein, partial [Candidatus Limnocylindria bacterium]|nr:amino acid adenylation domain-containing protein [Candidatus Limnocylindria bacterium]
GDLKVVPIGRPVANTRCYILDAQMNPVPAGETGELYIGGIQVGAGYHNRPELTAERFVPDIFEPLAGTKLYRTGDLARYLSGGVIEYLGRTDFQVKLRGQRIELGEIEAALAGLPGIKDAVVVAREATPGDLRLVAYLVARRDTKLEVARMPVALQGVLPKYMIPAVFVVLETLPLLANGKTDRKSLPTPDFSLAATGRPPFIQPVTAAERLVAKIWRELLQIDSIGTADHFFELGGHSILALRALARLRLESGTHVMVRTLFEHPTLGGFALALEECRTHGVTIPPLRPSAKDVLPVASFAQQRLWFLDQYEPGRPTYNLPICLRISGTLEVGALRRALSEILRRHAVFRTVFHSENGNLRIGIRDPEPIELELADLTGADAAKRTEMALRAAEEEVGTPFDLSRGRLLRARLIVLGPDLHWLVLNQHHIASDGWSMGVLLREMGALYSAFSEGKPSPLVEPAIQYSDFAVWQREWTRAGVYDRSLQYWLQKLADAPSVMEFPWDFPRPAKQSFRGGLVAADVSPELVQVLDRLSRSQGVTRFMLLLAAFQVLLHRYSQQEDLIIGSPVAERDQPLAEGLIGLCVNTLALRADLSGDPKLAELLVRIRRTVLDALAHQELPLEVLLEKLGISRSPSHSPLIQVFFGMQQWAPQALTLPGMAIEPVDVGTGASRVDLTVTIEERQAGLRVLLEYNSDLLTHKSAGELLGRYITVLQGMEGALPLPISCFPLLRVGERERLLVLGTQAGAEYPRHETLDGLFLRQVRRTPHAVALREGARSWTYEELNDRAEAMAWKLKAAGVGLDELVGLHLDRSHEFVIAMLGVLKVGAVYVPLATEYPVERLRGMIEEAGLKFVVTSVSLPRELCLGLCVIVAGDALSGRVAPVPPPIRQAGEAAYVMFTSGSTGRPKGVVVPHRAIVRLICGQDYMPWNEAQRFLLLAPVSFDASTFEIWAPLLTGGCCVVYIERHLSLDRLGRIIRDEGIDCLWLTASLFNEIIDQRAEILQPVKYLLTGGEALSVRHVEKALAVLPGTQLINGYGPTEGTTFTTTFAIPGNWSGSDGRSVPIGRPLANTHCYVLDEQRQLAAPGMPGELYIGGDGVALGYLNRPDLTSERFVPDLFGGDSGRLLYRTGDRVRWLPEGNLEFLGRFDGQVKVRGFRIELGEIEHALRSHPAVDEAAVTTWMAGEGDTRLVAYLVSPREGLQNGENIRAHLCDRLPSYMIPSAFHWLERLPLSKNGKIDRKALPPPAAEETLGEMAAEYTATEAVVARIWGELLGLGRIDSGRSFFELGGHSLLAMRVIARLNIELGVELQLRAIFEHPTISSLARWLETLSWAGSSNAHRQSREVLDYIEGEL